MDGSRSRAGQPRALIDRGELRRLVRPLAPMGTQPSLDGIRAISVILVIFYHAGFAAVHGGFFGVEVFFVVSGYLITSLLWEERSRQGRVALGSFWHRRLRRLMPALLLMLLLVTAWSVWFAEEQVDGLRRDLLPALLYVGNWGQIFGSVPYFSTADPLLRHVWSLAVEEQWYLVWPVAFVGLMRLTKANDRLLGWLLASLAGAIALWSAVLAGSTHATISVFGQQPDRFNFLYLNTITRSSGLLLGAGLAMLWRPWSSAARTTSTGALAADAIGFGAVAAIVAIACTRGVEILVDPSLYRIWLPLVTALSAVAVGAAVHPDSRRMRTIFGGTALVAIGRRSYGLYLWHWPVFALVGVRADHRSFVPALLVAAGLAELSYRLVETPVRQGAFGRWWKTSAAEPGRRWSCLAIGSVGVLGIATVLAVRVIQFEAIDPSVDTAEVAFELPVPPVPSGSSSVPSVAAITDDAVMPVASIVPVLTVGPVPILTDSTTSTTQAPVLPRRLAIVGDSQAHALAINQPSGLDATFTMDDGSVDGCGVWDVGSVRSSRQGFRRNFANCVGWQQKWADAVTRNRAEVALVVLGAWDVFDVDVDGTLIEFGSSTSDQLFRNHVQSGVDAVVAVGAKVALLEVACMRPVDVKGAGVPALPERGDDTRVAHLNALLRQVATNNPNTVTFIAGPTQWCSDPVIATDLGYRWDGVHTYKPGVNLVFETIAPALLAIQL